jgi:hypothetical protein
MKCVQDLGTGDVTRVSDAVAAAMVEGSEHPGYGYVPKRFLKEQIRKAEEETAKLLRKAYDDDLLKRQAEAAARLGNTSKLDPPELRHGRPKKAPRVRMKKKSKRGE